MTPSRLVHFIILSLAFGGISPAEEAGPFRVVLMGDSCMITSYLPDEMKHTAVLQQAINQQYGEGKAEVLNWADNGLFIARYLIDGRYDLLRERVGSVDLFIIRFGVNDAKYMTPVEFGVALEQLLKVLIEDYPGAKFILEDGLYVDYPAHSTSDRSRVQFPYWEQTRRIAREREYPLSSLFAASEKSTRNGDWDLRIRRQDKKVITMDASKDFEHVGDIGWFTEIHPNPAGVRLAVELEMQAIKQLYPEGLASVGTKVEKPNRTREDYITLLNFSPDRLIRNLKTNQDKFQKPVQ